MKRPAFESLVEDREAVAIPPEDLDAITPAIAKDEEMPAGRRLFQNALHHAAEAIE